MLALNSRTLRRTSRIGLCIDYYRSVNDRWRNSAANGSLARAPGHPPRSTALTSHSGRTLHKPHATFLSLKIPWPACKLASSGGVSSWWRNHDKPDPTGRPRRNCPQELIVMPTAARCSGSTRLIRCASAIDCPMTRSGSRQTQVRGPARLSARLREPWLRPAQEGAEAMGAKPTIRGDIPAPHLRATE